MDNNPRMHCDANLRLHSLLTDMRELRRSVQAWLGLHGADCPCPFCSKGTVGENMEFDLHGIDWALNMGQSTIDGVIVGAIDAKELERIQQAFYIDRIAEEDSEEDDVIPLIAVER